MKTINAGNFKARCLAIMHEVQAKRQAVVITKRGKPVAKLVPVEQEKDDIFGFFKSKGKVEIKGDIVAPAISPGFPTITARQKQRGLAISAMSLIEIARLSRHGHILVTPDLETFSL